MPKTVEKTLRQRAAPVKAARTYTSQADVPSLSLEKALRVPQAIADEYGYKAATPLQVAGAMNLTPSSSGFRMLAGAAIAYGLTVGGGYADSISISPLGMRVVKPTVEGDDLVAKRQAFLKPRIIREFLTRYDGAPFPKPEIAKNVLLDMGVPRERTQVVLDLILEGATSLGFIREIKEKKFVGLNGAQDIENPEDLVDSETVESLEPAFAPKPHTPRDIAPTRTASHTPETDARAKRVFITHGKNQALIAPIQKLLKFGEMEPFVSVQHQSVSQPVPGKVMEEMRSCGAAIIHVEDERRLADQDGTEHIVLNENVLIEIGAAMALYGQRFILVVKHGVQLPSNLQGLLELRYKGETLDMPETVNLVEAIQDMKKRPLP